MANFKSALDKVLSKEGGYVNDPDDKGGETYKGISRKHNPNWRGWRIIDDIKKDFPKISNKDMTDLLRLNINIEKEVYYLYKNDYWNCLELDDIPNQMVAECIFDTCVNQGMRAAVKFAQRVIGVKEDGRWTLDLLNKLVSMK